MIKNTNKKLKQENKANTIKNNLNEINCNNQTVGVAYHATRNAITLIALVITIIVLLVLAGVTLMLTIGQGGLLDKSDKSVSQYNKEEATEAMNLKITNIQIKSYTETQQLPNLQYLADNLCEDDEMEYVVKRQKEVASLDKIDVRDVESIFTKIKKYPYEFEINSRLQLASVDGVKIVDIQENNNSEQIEQLKTNMKQMQAKLIELEETKNRMDAEIIALKQKEESLEALIRNANTTFTELGSTTSTTAKNITLGQSLSNFKYIIVLMKNTNNGNCTVSGMVPINYFKSMGTYLMVAGTDEVVGVKYLNDINCSMYATSSQMKVIIYGVK